MNRKRGLSAVLSVVVSLLLLAADQLTKHYVLTLLKPVQTHTVLPKLLEFTYVENRAAAFGLFQNHMWVIYALSVVAFVALLLSLFLYRGHTIFSYSAVILILSGGIGNLIDRFRFGFVVDFIHVLFFDYVFNFADCCVTVGAVLLVVHALVLTYREKKEAEELAAEHHE